jgi:hypothetical protein
MKVDRLAFYNSTHTLLRTKFLVGRHRAVNFSNRDAFLAQKLIAEFFIGTGHLLAMAAPAKTVFR